MYGNKDLVLAIIKYRKRDYKFHFKNERLFKDIQDIEHYFYKEGNRFLIWEFDTGGAGLVKDVKRLNDGSVEIHLTDELCYVDNNFYGDSHVIKIFDIVTKFYRDFYSIPK